MIVGSLVIIWIMYIVLMVYNILDFVQTLMLINLGVGEANPIMIFAMDLLGTNYAIGMVKLVPGITLGCLLVVYSGNKLNR